MANSVWSGAGSRSDPSPAAGTSSSPETPLVGFIHPQVAQAVYTVLVELGANADALVAEVGLDPDYLDGGNTLVSYAVFGRLIALGAERTGCRHLSLLIGQQTTLASLGPMGLLMRNSDTVGDALRALEEHVGRRNWGAVIGLCTCGGVAVLSHSPYRPGAEGAAHNSERALATMTNLLRELCGPGLAPLEVLLPRSAPRDTRPYSAFFRAPLRFNEEVATLVFPTELLEQPIAGADPVARRALKRQIRQIGADQPYTLTDELRRYLQTSVTQLRCTADRVAHRQMTNRRTMARRLRAEGTSFKQLTSETQFQVAQRLLVDTGLSVTQVSEALHFSEPAAFTHAFRRWSGKAPSVWRLENRSTDAKAQREDPRPEPRCRKRLH
ncbi:AraC family transcriptional regulator [Methylobacterium sp. PvR107]|uniref:AraC family transcriptional regulator n=1 Tax=Methylobacterium sp. PvR107 TaxID=2806597 RepID=UPI001AE1C5CF|nr:AraC family transcriptional regulator [Methylobacterium sp. PvR107]MBP1179270.1 AraC-like DNA-binding protein [Methylobacterium sp. PvR107]